MGYRDSRLPLVLILLPVAWAVPQTPVFPGLHFPANPQCPNGVPPKTDRNGQPIQCLPGAGQHSVCGPVHTCFFSGINYMCCPTNEPPADAQPVCPNGLMTVTDSHHMSVRCYPGRRACPSGGQLCLHSGREREHVCCEKVLARVKHTPTHSTAIPLGAGEDEVVHKVLCPGRSLAVLNAEGNNLHCTADDPCPGLNQICFGTTRKAICCQEQPLRRRQHPKAMVDHEAGVDTEKERRETITTALRRNKEITVNKMDKRQQFLNQVHSMNDGEMAVTTVQAPRRIKKVRKTTTSTTSTTTSSTTTASPEEVEYEYYYVDEEGNELTTTSTTTITTTTQAPTTRMKRRRKTTTTTAAPSTTEMVEVQPAVEPLVEPEQKDEKSFESGETAFRNRPQAQVDENAITEPQFARPRARASKTQTGAGGAVVHNTAEKKVRAQNIIMRHIKNGWPYNDRYYRPDREEVPLSTEQFAQ